ncbi:UNVERIFIED_ORG: dGTPase [Sphingomonas sp. R1F5B]
MSWNERRETSPRQADDSRSDEEIDYARVVHSASFRRLQGKTQILNLGDSDFYRTRLTHSLEVAQIASGIAKQLGFSFPQHPASSLLPDRALIQAIGLTHDFGHPPFGHGGEVALNYCMPADQGFEGNGQTLRILARLEDFSKSAGANLTRRAMLGILKYPVPFFQARNPDIIPKLAVKPTTLRIIDTDASKPPKCYLDSEQDIVDWILKPLTDHDRHEFQTWNSDKGKHNKPRHKSLDCSIMDAADDIAYGVHDLEDAIALNLISKERFVSAVEDKCPSLLEELKKRYPDENEDTVFSRMVEGLFGERGQRKRYIGRLVHHFIAAVEYDERTEFIEPLLKYRVRVRQPQRAFLDVLQKLVVDEVIKSPNVQHLEFKGQGMVVAVFEALQSDPKRLLPADALKQYYQSGGNLRVICDHVAGMTDNYLLKTYERLFAPRLGSVFDKL